MSTNLRPIPPPINTPMVDENNMVTRAWADFFNAIYRYEELFNSVEEDGTYTVGLGSVDGELTISSGLITEIQEVVS